MTVYIFLQVSRDYEQSINSLSLIRTKRKQHQIDFEAFGLSHVVLLTAAIGHSSRYGRLESRVTGQS